MAKNNDASNGATLGLEPEEQFVIKYAKPLISLVIIILAAIISYQFYTSKRDKLQSLHINKAFKFESNYLSAQDFDLDGAWSAYQNLKAEVGVTDYLVPTALKLMNKLVEKKEYKKCIELLKPFMDKVDANSLYSYIIGLQLARFYEDTKQTNEAISILEGLGNHDLKIMDAKRYLDLGRLYLKLQNKAKAKQNLDFILSRYPTDSLVPMAKYFLGKL